MLKGISIIIICISIMTACSNFPASPPASDQSGASADLQTNVLAGQSWLLSPVKVREMLQTATPPKIIDVRTPEEYVAGCLEGATDIDIAAPDFESKLATLDKNASYLVYCRSGRRSADAVQRMKNLGFGNIVELEGGINAWQSQGLPIKNNCS